MNVDIHGAPIYFEIPILGGIKITASLVVTWGVMLVLTLVCIFLTHGMKVNNISKRQALAEKIVLTAENFVRSNMGEQWLRMVPFISAIFALSLGSSLASLLGFWAPTADVSVLLGHTNVMTTNTFYAGARPSRVVQNVLSGWDSNRENDDGDWNARLFAFDVGNKVQGKGFEPSNSYENRP